MAGEDQKNKLEWLDEERRKDKALVNKLKEKVSTLESALAVQNKSLQELSAQVAHLGVRMQPAQMEEAIARSRDDVARQVDTIEKRRLELEEQSSRSRNMERERLDKTFADIQKQLDVVAALKDGMDARKEEQLRQSAALADMRKTLDGVKQRDEERSRLLSSMEESRKQDIRRMADIQGEQQAIRQKASEGDARLDAVESAARRLESKIADLLASELDRRNALSVWQEQQTSASVALERQWKDWERRMSASVTQMEEFLGRLETYSETLRAMRQALNDFKETNDRVDQRMREMAEVQRVQDDRLRQDWTTFLADDQKRWTAQNLSREDEWREHDRQFAKTVERLTKMEEKVEDFTNLVRGAQEGDRARLEALANLMREWLARFPQNF